MEIKETVNKAIETLRSGGVILYPTDTVWGLGCDATNQDAVEKIFAIKKRSEAKSLVVLAPDLDAVALHVRQIPSIAIDLVEVNDAPMTIVYPGAEHLAPSVIAQDGTVGIRIPNSNEFCMQLLRRYRKLIVSTSANISGDPTPLGFKEISKDILDAVDYIVPRQFDKDTSGKASQIIKIGLAGEVEIIRA